MPASCVRGKKRHGLLSGGVAPTFRNALHVHAALARQSALRAWYVPEPIEQAAARRKCCTRTSSDPRHCCSRTRRTHASGAAPSSATTARYHPTRLTPETSGLGRPPPLGAPQIADDHVERPRCRSPASSESRQWERLWPPRRKPFDHPVP